MTKKKSSAASILAAASIFAAAGRPEYGAFKRCSLCGNPIETGQGYRVVAGRGMVHTACVTPHEGVDNGGSNPESGASGGGVRPAGDAPLG